MKRFTITNTQKTPRRGRLWSTVLLLALFLNAAPLALGEEAELPLVRKLMKPKTATTQTAEGKKEEANKPRFPPKLGIDKTWDNPGDVLVAKPLFYLEAPNGQDLLQALSKSAVARYLDDQKTQKFSKNNPLGLSDLFTDLPNEHADPNRLAVLSAFLKFVSALSDTPRAVALAAYPNAKSGFELVFLADIGRSREAPFARFEKLRDSVRATFGRLQLKEGERGKDFIDVLRAGEGRSAWTLAIGIVRNFVVVTNNLDTAQKLLALSAEGTLDAPLRASKAYRDMERRSSQFDMRGFVSLRGLNAEMSKSTLPAAAGMIAFASDIAGLGKTQGRGAGSGTVYYDMRVDGKHVRESIVSPTLVNAAEKPGLPRRLQDICAPAAKRDTGSDSWVTAALVPYQPDFYLAGRVKPAAFMQLMSSPSPLFGNAEYSRQIRRPTALVQVVSALKNHASLLGGEVALALLPKRKEKTPWLIVITLTNPLTAHKVLAGAAPAKREVSGVDVFSSGEEEEVQDAQCWAVFSKSTFKHLSSSLVIASDGAVMERLIDQAIAISVSFGKSNEDFRSLAKRLGRGHNVVWYYNVPAVATRMRNQFRANIKQYFPRTTGSNLPPSMSQQVFGLIGGAQVKAGSNSIRTNLISPLPMIPTLSSLLVLNMPRWIRTRARAQMSSSRINLQQMWLKLQTYATERGHFPNEPGAEGIGKVKRLFSKWKKKRVERLFTSPAAKAKLGVDAVNRSYAYVEGLRATDEPDQPIIYEAGPWHHEYKGMLAPDAETGEQETGPYLRWRLVLQLDGTIRQYTEREFIKRVLPRIKAKE